MDVLAAYGLVGRQLQFKLDVIRHFNAQFADIGKRWLRKLLDAIDVLLGSIIKALNLGDAAEELKECIEKIIND